jgi:hypothetical protein
MSKPFDGAVTAGRITAGPGLRGTVARAGGLSGRVLLAGPDVRQS